MSRLLALTSVALATLLASGAAGAQGTATAPAAPPAPAPAKDVLPAPTAPTAPTAPAAPTAPTASAGPRPGAPPRDAPVADAEGPKLVDLQNAPPPPTNVVYLQYGVAFTAEVVSAAGPICDNIAVPCILGPGGGVVIRAGWRGTGPFYLGGAYEFSKQDPNKLLRLAILQQVRAEGRYYFISGRDAEPYLTGGLGVAGYGNEWGIDTWGPSSFAGLGVEGQITRRTVIGAALAYRLIYFQKFTDTTGAPRDSGVAQLIGLDLVLEQREAIYTEGASPRR